MESASLTLKPPPAPQRKLLRILGVGFGIAVILGGTVAAGILHNPGTVAGYLGNPWLILAVWLLGGIYALLGALVVAELGTMLPQAGGFYVYTRRALGDYAGFAVGWSDWLGGSASLAYMAIAVGEYAAKLWPALADQVRLLAVLTLLLFAGLHWLGLRLSSRVQELTSLLKALAFLALVGACFLYAGEQSAAGFAAGAGSMPATPWNFCIALVLALQLVIGTYDGWQGAIYFAEEDRDPARNLPRSMFGGALCVLGLYLLVNLALLWVLPLPQLMQSQLALADAAQTLFGAHSGQLITALALVALLSALNANLFIPTRVLFALGRDQLFATQAATVNAGGTPGVAMLLTTLAGMLFVVVKGRFDVLFSIFAFFTVVNYSACFVSLLVLRWREPELPRPFRVWGYPWTILLVLIASLVFLIGSIISDKRNSLYALVLLAASYPVYEMVRSIRKKGTS
jgi:APA family basic amino acid/polyamine antiporter